MYLGSSPSPAEIRTTEMAKCVRVFLTNTAMISKKLQFLFLLSLMLIVIHGIEEQLTGFRHTDSFVIALGSYLRMSPEAFYWAFHISFRC